MNMVASVSSSCCGCSGNSLRSDDDNDEQIDDNVIDTGADRKHQNYSVADLPNIVYVVTKVPSVCNREVSSSSNEVDADDDLSKKHRRRGRLSLSSYYRRMKKETQQITSEQHNQKIHQVTHNPKGRITNEDMISEQLAPSSPSSVANILVYTNTDSVPRLSKDEGHQFHEEETTSKKTPASKETRSEIMTRRRSSRATAA